MAVASEQEAYQRYGSLYTILISKGGLDGLIEWERRNCEQRLDEYTRSRILKGYLSRNVLSFSDFLALIVPPTDLLAKPGTT